MPRATATARRPLGQLLVVCCVLVAVAIVGLSSTLVSLLGTQHVHARQARLDPATLVLEDFRRVAHHDAVAASPSHEHQQSSWQRHRHDAADSSVQSLGTGASKELSAGDGTASALAAIVLIACAANGLAVPIQSGSTARGLTEPQLLSGCDAHPLERPPKA